MKGFKDSVSVATPNNHELNLSHQVNTSFDFYQFRPVFCEEMYPTDKMSVSLRDYNRAAPMAGACYANIYKKYSAFFVPFRILWKHWNDFLTGGSNGRLEFSVPHVKLVDFAKIASNLLNAYAATSDNTAEHKHLGAVYRNILDFWSDLGMPIDWLWNMSDSDTINDEVADMQIPLLRFLAARRVWFDWYRDQNLIGDDVEDSYCPKDFDGYCEPLFDEQYYKYFTPVGLNGKHTYLSPLPVAVEKDYFTTGMTEPQRGGASFVPVQLPSIDLNPGLFLDNPQAPSGAVVTKTLSLQGWLNGGPLREAKLSASSGESLHGTPTNIIGQFDYNLIRVAKGVQQFLEKNNIAGGADLQQLLAHWGTAPNPAVFQKSTFIGSFIDNVNIQELAAPVDNQYTNAGEITTKLNASARGSFEYTANEHGFFMIVMICRPENTYLGGIPRELLHGCLGNGRFDFYTPELEKTGFQPSYNYEKTSHVLLDLNAGEDAHARSVSCYVPRYAETKRKYNRYSGQMATQLYKNLRVIRDFSAIYQLDDNDLFINTDFTMVYGYPETLTYDMFFKIEEPLLDHFDGWIHFDVKVITPRNEYSAPLVQDVKGDDIQLPYAGVRM